MGNISFIALQSSDMIKDNIILQNLFWGVAVFINYIFHIFTLLNMNRIYTPSIL